MTVNEADKINALYKQLDDLTAENSQLRAQVTDHSEVLDRLKSIEKKLAGGVK